MKLYYIGLGFFFFAFNDKTSKGYPEQLKKKKLF